MADQDHDEDLASTVTCDLPGDITIDILTRLPIKCLIRFKSVSKSWHNLVQHPTFVAMHYKRSESPGNVLVIRRRESFPKVSKLFTVTPPGYEVVEGHYKIPYPGCCYRMAGCCNGLVCLVSDEEYFNTNIFLYNPAIREFLPLPESRFSRMDENNQIGYLAFGFGHDPVCNDYKVVKVEVYDAPGKSPPHFFHAEVYSLSTDFWREIEFSEVVATREKISMVHVNGTIYWGGFRNNNLAYNVGERIILMFDVAKEEFGTHTLPNVDHEGRVELGWQIQMWKKHLTVVYYYRVDGDIRFDFWLWCQHISGEPGFWNRQMVVGPYPGFNYFIGSTAENFDFFFYNTRTEGLSVVKNPNGDVVHLKIYSQSGALDMVNYKESLVTVKGRNYVKRDIIQYPNWKDHIMLAGGAIMFLWLIANILSTRDGFYFLLEIVVNLLANA